VLLLAHDFTSRCLQLGPNMYKRTLSVQLSQALLSLVENVRSWLNDSGVERVGEQLDMNLSVER